MSLKFPAPSFKDLITNYINSLERELKNINPNIQTLILKKKIIAFIIYNLCLYSLQRPVKDHVGVLGKRKIIDIEEKISNSDQNQILNAILKKFGVEIADHYDIINILQSANLSVFYSKKYLDSTTNTLDGEFLSSVVENNPVFTFLNHIDQFFPLESYNLGSFYEQLLQVIEKQKDQGSFFTPKLLSDFIVEQVFNLYLKENLNIKIENFNPLEGQFQIKCDEEEQKIFSMIEVMESLTILDPSVGTGHFIESILSFLLKLFLQIKTTIKKHYDSILPKKWKYFKELRSPDFEFFVLTKKIIPHLFGIDIDPNALLITKMRILQFIGQYYSPDKKNNFEVIDLISSCNLFCKNTLTDSLPSNFPRFDIVIGNPPYVNNKEISRDLKNKIKVMSYELSTGQYDLFTLFIEKSIYFLKQSGTFCLIVPDSLRDRSNFKPVREFLIRNLKLESIVGVKNAFADPSVATLIVLGSKYNNFSDDYNIKFSELDFSSPLDHNLKAINLNKEVMSCSSIRLIPTIPLRPVSPIALELLNYLLQFETFEEYIQIKRGEEIGKKDLEKVLSKRPGYRKIISGKNISRYNISGFYGIKKSAVRKKDNLYLSPKICVRQLDDKIKSAIDYQDDLVTLQSVYMIKSKNQTLPLQIIQAFLSSKLMAWFDGLVFRGKVLFSRLLIENIKQFPFKKPDESYYQVYIHIVNLLHILSRTQSTAEYDLDLLHFVDKEILENLIFETFFFPKMKLGQLLFSIIKETKEKKNVTMENLESPITPGLHEFYSSLKEKIRFLMKDKEFLERVTKIRNSIWVKSIQKDLS